MCKLLWLIPANEKLMLEILSPQHKNSTSQMSKWLTEKGDNSAKTVLDTALLRKRQFDCVSCLKALYGDKLVIWRHPWGTRVDISLRPLIFYLVFAWEKYAYISGRSLYNYKCYACISEHSIWWFHCIHVDCNTQIALRSCMANGILSKSCARFSGAFMISTCGEPKEYFVLKVCTSNAM